MKSTVLSETRLEIKSALSLSSIFGLRMLAIFMFIPIFTAYTETLQGATPFLMGVAMGVYGLTQAIFQLPLGAWSDKSGRKPVIMTGMLLFAAGSLIGAFADNIHLMILARALQGTGAVGSTLMALLADLTSEKNRTKAMAGIGISMGLFSALAIITGPAVANHFGLSGVFVTSTLLTGGSLIILYLITPNPSTPIYPRTQSVSMIQLFRSVLKDPVLLQLDLGIFLLHAIFTAMFYACPLILKSLISDTAFFYLPILVVAFVLLFPCILFAERKKQMSHAFLISIAILFFSQILLTFFHNTLWVIGIALSIFFISFNFLEAALPSMVSKKATSKTKGTAMGIYSSAQFLGIFAGGTCAGFIFSLSGIIGVFIFTSFLAAIWLGMVVVFKPKLMV